MPSLGGGPTPVGRWGNKFFYHPDSVLEWAERKFHDAAASVDELKLDAAATLDEARDTLAEIKTAAQTLSLVVLAVGIVAIVGLTLVTVRTLKGC